MCAYLLLPTLLLRIAAGRRRAGLCRWGAAALIGALIAAAAVEAAVTPVQGWRIDEAHTLIGFKIDAIGFPTTHGRFGHFSGRILIDFDRPAKSSTNFTVDASSVDVGSPAYTDFVKSAVLLNVEKFPTLSFASTQVEKLDARTAKVTGNLTMLGVSKPITLNVDVDTGSAAKGRAIAFVATGMIARSDFGMIFGIPLIDDKFEITVKTRALNDE